MLRLSAGCASEVFLCSLILLRLQCLLTARHVSTGKSIADLPVVVPKPKRVSEVVKKHEKAFKPSICPSRM